MSIIPSRGDVRKEVRSEALIRVYSQAARKARTGSARSVSDPPRGRRNSQLEWYGRQIRLYLNSCRTAGFGSAVVQPNMTAACSTPSLFDLAVVIQRGVQRGDWRVRKEGPDSWRLFVRCDQCNRFHRDWRSDGKATPCTSASGDGGHAA